MKRNFFIRTMSFALAMTLTFNLLQSSVMANIFAPEALDSSGVEDSLTVSLNENVYSAFDLNEIIFKSINNGKEVQIYDFDSFLGKSIKAEADIIKDKSQKIVMLMALKEKTTNRLQAVNYVINDEETSGRTTISCNIDLPEDFNSENSIIEVYMLDGFDTLRPLCNKTVFPTNKFTADSAAEYKNATVNDNMISEIKNDSYVKYENVILNAEYTTFSCNVETPLEGTYVEVWIDGKNEADGGTKISELNVTPTETSANQYNGEFNIQSSDILQPVNGEHDFYFVFKNANGIEDKLCNVKWMKFGTKAPYNSNNIMKIYYVSIDGDDNNDGLSVKTPFASLERARNAVRSINDNMTGDIVVSMLDGTWELDDTLSFGTEDSGRNEYNIRYVAYEDATPVLSGGTKIAGEWTKTKLENGKTAYTTPLNRDTKLRALYVNGERRYMAHTENPINAQGSWGNYTISYIPKEDEVIWQEIYKENFENTASVGNADDTIQKYAKSGNNENSILNIVTEEDGNRILQIAHTENEDCGFEIPSITYNNAIISYKIKFGENHIFTHEWEALHMHGANKLINEQGRTTWAGIKLAPHLKQEYFQYGTSGAGNDDVTPQQNTTEFSAENNVWYHVKMMITDDGSYYTKIWEDGNEEPDDWSRKENFSNLNGQEKFFRLYAYKNNDNSTMDIRVDDIVIQTRISKEDVDDNQLPDWAWNTGSKFDGIMYNTSDLPKITKNISDVEIENQQTWNKNTVCVREIEETADGKWILKLQQPYGAIAQTPGWGVGLQGRGNHVIYNAYELLDTPGEFYFDRAAKLLYYIPMNGEDITSAEVVVPRLETIIEFKGTPSVAGDLTTAGEKMITGQVKNIIFDNISVAHSDWNLQKVGDSYGKSTVQAGTVYTAFASGNWHADMYRNLDTIPGAVEMEFAHNIQFVNGEVKLTGAEGILLSNDVDGCKVEGNYIYQTGGGGVVVGNPQHVYENDSLEPDTYYYKHVSGDGKPEVSGDGASADHEKYQNGTERAPRNVTISNNLLLDNCRLFPSHCPITSFFTQNMVVSNNFIKNASYSGMSIGWGWCNFDGTTAETNKWGTENTQGYSILAGIPTKTCFGNKIVNNRIDTVMTILHDGGLIYTLGEQKGTEISNNYVTNSQNHGIYMDEGSAYFKTISKNVIANIPSSGWNYSIAAHPYGRKHNLDFDYNYSNNNNPNIAVQYEMTNTNYQYIANSIWPKEACDIIQNSGITAQYRARFIDVLIQIYGSVQDIILPQKTTLCSGESLSVNSWLDKKDEIWLAPAGTIIFNESENMIKAEGNAQFIDTSDLNAGTYHLYVKQNGKFSTASKATVIITND